MPTWKIQVWKSTKSNNSKSMKLWVMVHVHCTSPQWDLSTYEVSCWCLKVLPKLKHTNIFLYSICLSASRVPVVTAEMQGQRCSILLPTPAVLSHPFRWPPSQMALCHHGASSDMSQTVGCSAGRPLKLEQVWIHVAAGT